MGRRETEAHALVPFRNHRYPPTDKAVLSLFLLFPMDQSSRNRKKQTSDDSCNTFTVYPMQTINYQTYWQQISLPAGIEPAIIKESARQVWFPIPAGFEPTLQNPRHTLRDTLAHRCTSMYKLCGSCGYSISLPEWIIMEKKLRKPFSHENYETA